MAKSTIHSIEEKIKKHQQDLKDLQDQLVEAKLESPDKQLATELHSMLCTWNHTDGCGWYYEFDNKKDNWTGHAHAEYLKKSQVLIHECNKEGVSVQKALSLFKTIKGI